MFEKVLYQLGVQLGITGLVILVVYKLGVLFISKWSKLESDKLVEERRRTDALSAGLKAITDRMDLHSTAIVSRIENHAQDDLKAHADFSSRIGRIEGKLDGVLDQDRERTNPGERRTTSRRRTVDDKGDNS